MRSSQHTLSSAFTALYLCLTPQPAWEMQIVTALPLRELRRLGSAPEVYGVEAMCHSTDRGLPQGHHRDQDSITAPQAQWITEDAKTVGSDPGAQAIWESEGAP